MGALDAGGRTVVFLGCGLDYCYPAENRKLYDKIAAEDKGAIVSEFAPGVSPEPWRFPARNRLISGMSMGVLVIETPADSGAMITANDAAGQGRDVFVVPGPIDTGKSAGCHKLIQDGARLVESAQEIMDALGLLTFSPTPDGGASSAYTPAPTDLAPDLRTVLELLSLDPIPVDHILSQCRLTTSQVIGVMTLLEMRGLVRRLPGNRFVRAL
jgi:DNA processing protein